VYFLKKIQNYSENKKKIIVWAVVIVVALLLFVVYIFYVRWKIADFQKKGFMESADWPAINIQAPKLEIPSSIIDDLGTADEEITE